LQAVSVAEKGYVELALDAEGEPHHAALARRDGAPERLVRALARVLQEQASVRLIEPTERLARILSDVASGAHRILRRHPRLVADLGQRA
uniref:hypothetical protein n=1 Tax=Salmonella sp. SAL4359 TaxID=3159880 RepID=UPI00397BDB0E